MDEYAAALYASPKAPRFILVQWETIDRRHLLLDTPATWNAILSRYRLLLSDNTKLLLVRSEPAAAQPLVPVRTTTLRTKEWLDCPPDDAGGLRLSIDWRQTSAGRLASLLFRNTLCSVTLEYADGRQRVFRVVPDTLRTPFRIGQIPFDLDSFRAMLTPCDLVGLSVRRLRFDCANPFYYRDTLALTFHQPQKEQAAP
mgnify:FL=1